MLEKEYNTAWDVAATAAAETTATWDANNVSWDTWDAFVAANEVAEGAFDKWQEELRRVESND